MCWGLAGGGNCRASDGDVGSLGVGSQGMRVISREGAPFSKVKEGRICVREYWKESGDLYWDVN